MAFINIEIKARSDNQGKIRAILKAKNADFKGIDHQIDTYFNVSSGRLKLREGNIENQLIYYQRKNQEGPKQSDVTLFKSYSGSSLKEVLTKDYGCTHSQPTIGEERVRTWNGIKFKVQFEKEQEELKVLKPYKDKEEVGVNLREELIDLKKRVRMLENEKTN